ncbi:MAG: DEAD/DEAH box helicase [Kiritimatiellae bacterium]|nr:DEAD/DEAH box helicase [Kiritimatiellia bacterium]
MSTFKDGLMLAQRGFVRNAKLDGNILSGVISWGSRILQTRAKILPDQTCENQCPCRDSVERGIVCSHILAVGLTYLAKQANPEYARKAQEEERHAHRIETSLANQCFPRSPDGTPAKVHIALRPGWKESATTGDPVPVAISLELPNGLVPIGDVPLSTPLALSRTDEAILFNLEEIVGARIPSELALKPDDFIQLVHLCLGRSIPDDEGVPHLVETRAINTHVHVEISSETGDLTLRLRATLPVSQEDAEAAKAAAEAAAAAADAVYDPFAGPTVASYAAVPVQSATAELPTEYFWTGQSRTGCVLADDRFWLIVRLLPLPMREVYRHDVVIPRAKVPTYTKKELPTLRELTEVRVDPAIDAIDYVPGKPVFTLLVKGSPASLSFRLAARYGSSPDFVAGREQRAELFTEPDPDDLLRYLVRNLAAERIGLARLARLGIVGDYGDELSPIVGLREVRNFLGAAVPVLIRNGWKIEWEGRIAPVADEARFATPVVSVTPSPTDAGGWFDVSFSYDDGEGGTLSMAEVERALAKGDAYIERHGKTLLLDADAIKMLKSVFEDCASREGTVPGSFRLSSAYAAYAAGSLRGLDGVDIEAPQSWLDRFNDRTGHLVGDAQGFLEPSLSAVLRPYQKEGVKWLRILQLNGFSGILADDMGLGKTLQTLAWFSMLLHDLREANDHRPCLVVCPTSIVENWAAEAERFTPHLKVQIIAGPDRTAALGAVPDCDLAITSYALLRRDIDFYRPIHFAAIALDEAQHIKNQTTQVSRATKQLVGDHRLVLTGTPIENGISDLWSIMDFLMPGYLGPHPVFKKTIEQPILDNTAEGELAAWKLRKKMAPFLLRRLKSDVAKELPPKIERVAYCSLTPDQRTIYTALLENSRRHLVELVKEKGFQRSRFEILQTLLRLRQCCCHIGLLKLQGLEPAAPSAKLELFHEILNEAIEGGHRLLLFSQFVTMLKILAKDLDENKIPYCYLDGSTTNRLQIVKSFNTDPSIPVFLISLKAGGTGLNLTGADIVVHFDPWWNPAVENQATDRAYRIGQRRTVYSVKLITKDTVEERVLAMQERKQRLYDMTLSDAATRLDDLSALTWEDVKEILSI